MLNRIINSINLRLVHKRLSDFSTDNRFVGTYNQILAGINEHKPLFEEKYNYYIKNISSDTMAVSLEQASLLYSICESLRPSNISDFGSGFSSFVFRSYQKNNQGTTVTSIDDDKDWLLKTKDFLQESHVSTENVSVFSEDFSNITQKQDLIFYDLNFVEKRILYIDQLVNILSENGVIIFDDVHKADYLTKLVPLLKSHNLKYYSLSSIAKDKFGRFPLIAHK